MLAFPVAKINLGLHITAKRPDGYHELETVFYPIKLSDVIEIIPSGDSNTSFTSSGIDIPGDKASNLCLKAYHLMKEKKPGLPGVKMHLHKIIPIGAGLGGGSSDASFVLKLLNEMFDAGFQIEELSVMAASLGSDCAFFIQASPAFASGRGEILSPLPTLPKGYHILLVCPQIHVSTAFAYSMVSPKQPEIDLKQLYQASPETWKGNMVNDFEKGIFSKHNSLARIKDDIYELGAIYASMSGSGSSLFGIFEQEIEVPAHLFPDCFIWQGEL